jgi:putative solute:sodium symporter small subunit
MIRSELDQHNPSPESAQTGRYWQRARRLTGWLLVLWTFVCFGLTFFARSLNFSFFGWPFSFWVAAQGALFVFCAIVSYYAYAMRKLDEASR